MKALVFRRPGGVDVISVEDMQLPEPGPGEISIDVAYCGLNFADALARKGVAGYASRWPFVPGLEVSGTVRAVGTGVAGFAIGAPVVALTVDGFGCAQVAIAKAALCATADASRDQRLLATVPLTWVTASALVERSAVDVSSRVLVTSASGGLAQAVATLLRRAGVEHLVGAVGSIAKTHRFDDSLWDDVLVRDEKFIASLGDRRFSTVFESVGGDVLSAVLRSTIPAGRVVSYGISSGSDSTPPDLGFLRRANLTLSGFSIIGLARTVPNAVARVMRRVLDDHWADVESAPPKAIALADAVEAHVKQARGESSGKTVVALQ